jgi:hypothetical protein
LEKHPWRFYLMKVYNIPTIPEIIPEMDLPDNAEGKTSSSL